MKPIHVVQLGPIPPPHGGIASNMLAIREELLSRGHRCSLVATSRSAKVTDETDVHHPASPTDLVRTVRKLKPDVVHLHVGGDIPTRVLALALFATAVARRSVFTLHSGGYPRSPQGKAATAASMRGMIFRRFSRVIAVNAELEDVFLRYGVTPEKIRRIAPFAPADLDPEIELPSKLAAFVQDHSPFLLAVGGLERDYDPLFQIGAMPDIVASHGRAGLMIVGDGSMRHEIDYAIAASPVKDNIMIAGSVDHAVTLHLIDRADALLRTTLFDGDAISVREGLHLGTPVIATDNGMRPDGVRLIEQGDAAAFIGHINEIVSANVPKMPQPADRANVAAIVDLYSSLVNEGGRDRS